MDKSDKCLLWVVAGTLMIDSGHTIFGVGLIVLALIEGLAAALDRYKKYLTKKGGRDGEK